jgi:hypothetical protein
MVTAGGKYEVAAYVTKDVYDFLTQERGPATVSKYLGALLSSYMGAVKNGEIPEDVNVN